MQQRLIPQRTVNEWVDYIQTLHHREIELSLERVNQVYRRLYPQGLNYKVISVAGTNGKGSTAEIIASIYNQSGFKVGKFSSPHLIEFGERYCINGHNASDRALMDAFTKIEQARADIPITYFEFGALLAIELFSTARVDVAVMEVGLGGRLDAINILDADVSLITSISIDHTAWLGDTVELIAREKVGIARSRKPCIVGIREPAKSIVGHCKNIDADLNILGQEFDYQAEDDDQSWSWRSKQTSRELTQLPLPFSQSGVQLSNAAIAIQAIESLSEFLFVDNQAIADGLEKAKILARCQIFNKSPLSILDVAHNESSVQRLRFFIDRQLALQSKQRVKVFAICGMLQDKEIAKSLSCLDGLVTDWHFATINNERGASADYLQNQLNSISDMSTKAITKHECVVKAYEEVLKMLTDEDILIVFGSFFVAGDILNIIAKH